MATVLDCKTVVATEERRWWRQPWGTLAAGFLLSFLVGIASARITEASGADWNHGFRWERELMIRVHHPLPAALDALMLICPWFGTNISLIPMVIVFCWWLIQGCNARFLAMRLATVQIGSYLLNPSLKALFDRQRPDMFERRGWYGWSSYPSGHAIASVSVLFTIAIILHRLKGWTWPFYVLVPLTLASMYSRVYLAVHWPTDVIAGALVGLVWLLATMWAYRNDRGPALRKAKKKVKPQAS